MLVTLRECAANLISRIDCDNENCRTWGFSKIRLAR